MNNFDYDEETRQYYEMALQEEERALQATSPVARRFTYAGFKSWSKGQFRRRKAVKEIELVTDRDTKKTQLLKNMPLDSLATEVYGRGDQDGAKYGGYTHHLHEKLLQDIRGLRA